MCKQFQQALLAAVTEAQDQKNYAVQSKALIFGSQQCYTKASRYIAGPWFSVHGDDGLTVGLDNLTGLFQLNDSVTFIVLNNLFLKRFISGAFKCPCLLQVCFLKIFPLDVSQHDLYQMRAELNQQLHIQPFNTKNTEKGSCF